MTPPLRVFLAGEGRSELGSRAGHPVYQSDDQPGVIVALVTRIQRSSWEIGGARMWKSIRKLRLGGASAKLAEVLDRKPNLEAMLAVVHAAILETLPKDAKSLASWLHSARVALPASAAGDD